VSVLERLRGIVGPAHVLTGVERSPYVIEGCTPEAVVFPGTVDEVAAAVSQAAEAGVPVVPWGGGTAMGVGVSPVRAGIVVVLTRLTALLEHEPGDLTATAQAGITLAGLQARLRGRGQWLSLDPPDTARATLGGVLASNASGPRRHLYGTARDVVIGVTVVTADGALVHGGGKVVKNVAGYDLPKLFVGSFGTLGVIVEATVKLRPLPEEERLVSVSFERVEDAGAAVRAVLASELIPNALDLVDRPSGAAAGLSQAVATLLMGFDGLGEQVDWQVHQLASLVAPCGGGKPVTLPSSTWERMASAARDAFDERAAIMTLSVLPTAVAETIAHGTDVARAQGLTSAWSAHAGVGYVTAALRADGARPDPTAVVTVLRQWREAARAGGGHACVAWAPLPVKSAVPVWDDAGAAGRIMQRIKAQLDPQNVLNPGRFVAGI